MDEESYFDKLRDEEYLPEDHSPVSAAGIFSCAVELGYLLFMLIAGCVFLAEANGRAVSFLYAALVFLLGAGDAFYLIPGVRGIIEGKSKRIAGLMQNGIAVSSGAITLSHVILFYIWTQFFSMAGVLPFFFAVIWGAFIFRLAACIISLADRDGKKYDRKWILYRCMPLAVSGMLLIVLFLMPAGSGGNTFWTMSLSILVSTGCSIPLEIWYEEMQKLGILFLPRAISYIAMAVTGLLLLI